MADYLKMPLMNEYVCAGRLTREPETRSTDGGMAVTKFSLAVTTKFQDKAKGTPEEVIFFTAKAFGQTAERCAEMKKGEPVLVRGNLKEEHWTDKATGEARKAIVLHAQGVQRLSWGKVTEEEGGDATPAPKTQPRAAQAPSVASEPPATDINEEELPF